jgi:hypothetical protein
MVGEHDDADLVFAGSFQDLRTSALGVIGVLGVNVKDGSKILIDAGRIGRMGANLHPFESLGVYGFEVSGLQALDGTAGEEEGGKEEGGKEPHTFILRGWVGFAARGMMNSLAQDRGQTIA